MVYIAIPSDFKISKGEIFYKKPYWIGGKGGEGKANAKNGEWYLWDSKGNLLSKTEYVDNIKNGLYVEYYHFGLIKKKVHFKNGLRDGKYSSWFINGSLKKTGTYIDGKKDGEFIRYHPIPKYQYIESIGKYQEGDKKGEWIYMLRDGTICSEITY